MTFKRAVEETPNLKESWRSGLGALRAQDKPHIKADDTRRLRGSVDVDNALLASQPTANRWDFAIGFKHSNRDDEYIYWVEIHTGSDAEFKVVLKKFEWLRKWLAGDGKLLDSFERDFVWLSSGATSFTQSAKQIKLLATKGLRYSGSALSIPDEHPISRRKD